MDVDLHDPGDQSFRFGDLYILKQPLGKGSFGRVVRCINKTSGSECAVKIISKTDLSIDLDGAASEVDILSSLHHPNIVKFQGIHHNKHHIFIEMELLRGGTLSDLLKRRQLTDEEAATVMRGILSAVSYLHNREILHRDLKPDNIMFLDDSNLSSLRVADFGLSAKFGQHVFAKTFEDMCGTVSFMAPEQIMHRNYSKPVDIWSCAITLYMVITQKHPLLESGDSVQKYTQRLQAPDWKFPPDFSPLAKQLFLHMTNLQPLERYTADQALTHPWVTRQGSEIPRTYLERISEYNAESQFKRLISALVAVGALLYNTRGKATDYPPLPAPQITISEEPVPVVRTAHQPSPMNSPKPLRRGTVNTHTYKQGSELRRRSTDCFDFSPNHLAIAKEHCIKKSISPVQKGATIRPACSHYLLKPRRSPVVNQKSL